jgi:hypothetical protein
MANLQAARDPQYTPAADPSSYPVDASAVIYAGAFVDVNSTSGFAEPVSAAAGLRFIGVALDTVKGGTVAGANEVKVQREAIVTCTADSIAQTDVGSAVYAVDDNGVSLSDGSDSGGDPLVVANRTQIGVIERYLSATSCRVRIIPTA